MSLLTQEDQDPRPGALTRGGIRSAILQGEPTVHKVATEQKVPPGYLTRNMLMDRTGLTNAELKQLEAHGRLKCAKKNRQGWALYPESIVAELVANAPRASGSIVSSGATLFDGSQSAEVFARLKEGRSLVEIVIEMRIHPEVVKAIVREYQNLEGVIFLSRGAVERVSSLLSANFPIDGEDALFDAVETVTKDKRCVRCSRRPGAICVGCARREAKPDASAAPAKKDDEASDAG